MIRPHYGLMYQLHRKLIIRISSDFKASDIIKLVKFALLAGLIIFHNQFVLPQFLKEFVGDFEDWQIK
jgi:hypothetical protein